jgi:hypothetical protein
MLFRTKKIIWSSYPIKKGLNEIKISIKDRPIQMNQELLKYRKTKINELLNKSLIRISKSHWSCWSCVAF